MFCSSQRELSFPECGGSKLLWNPPIPNYANTRHPIPDAVTWYRPPHSQYLPIFLRVSLYPIFLAVSFVTRVALSLNMSQNRNIMTDHWMSWHFIQGSAVLTGWVCEPLTCPQKSQLFTSLSTLYFTTQELYFVESPLKENVFNFISPDSSEYSTVRIWHSEDRASWYILIIRANKMHYFSTLFW
jgi:hypothetical protein